MPKNNPLVFYRETCDLSQFAGVLRKQHDLDVESIIDRYAHGECHAFTLAAVEQYGLGFVILRQEDGLGPVHSCLVVSGPPALYLDAYGLSTMDAIVGRYAHYGKLYVDDDSDEHALHFLADPGVDEDTIEDATLAIQAVLEAIWMVQQNRLHLLNPR